LHIRPPKVQVTRVFVSYCGFPSLFLSADSSPWVLGTIDVRQPLEGAWHRCSRPGRLFRTSLPCRIHDPQCSYKPHLWLLTVRFDRLTNQCKANAKLKFVMLTVMKRHSQPEVKCSQRYGSGKKLHSSQFCLLHFSSSLLCHTFDMPRVSYFCACIDPTFVEYVLQRGNRSSGTSLGSCFSLGSNWGAWLWAGNCGACGVACSLLPGSGPGCTWFLHQPDPKCAPVTSSPF
jgi:hypothetical protein